MNGKLFFTLSAAIVFGAVVSYAIITLFRRHEQKMLMQPVRPRGEIGFAAIMKQREAMANA
jgi:hypothetical protein